MKTQDEPESGWRGSREGWLQAAYRALIDSGIDAVRIQPLARQLGLSRTSFYWFFDDREALLTALQGLWSQQTTAPLIAATGEYAETGAEAMLNVLACFLSGRFDSRLEFALRSWALQDQRVAGLVQNADHARLEALAGMLTRWGHDRHDADIRARTVYLTQIGYISMQVAEDLETRLARIPAYVRIFTGTAVQDRELARFRAGLAAG